MGPLAASFAGWNLAVLLIILAIYGFSGLADRYKFFELLLTVLVGSIVLLIFLPLSLFQYMLIKSIKEEHGSYFRFFINTFKSFLEVMKRD